MPFPDEAGPISAKAALERLAEGNRRFVAGKSLWSHKGWRPGLAEGQSPFAVVLGCSDSRSPAEAPPGDSCVRAALRKSTALAARRLIAPRLFHGARAGGPRLARPVPERKAPR